MKILLISPQRSLSGNEKALRDLCQSRDLLTPQELYSGSGLGLLIVAALTPPDIEVEFLDENFDTIDYEKSVDLVALSAMTCQATRAYEIAGRFRSRGVKVIMGGIHATLLPDEASRYCDSVAIGEAELIWSTVMDDLRLGELKPRYQASGFAESTPIPRYSLLKGRSRGIYWISTTRGCPFSCNFCCSSRIFGKRYRTKPIDQVIFELEDILAVCGENKPKLVCFADDNMLVDRARARELATRLKPYKIKWFAQTDVSVATDEELLSLLHESGCISLFMGLESPVPSKLRHLGNKLKADNSARYPEIIERIHFHGITVMAAFIIGLDEDTETVFDEMIEFIKVNHLLSIQVSILTPLPGTPLREQLESEGRILASDWSHYNMTEVNYIPHALTAEQLTTGYFKIYQSALAEETLKESMAHFVALNLRRRQQSRRKSLAEAM